MLPLKILANAPWAGYTRGSVLSVRLGQTPKYYLDRRHLKLSILAISAILARLSWSHAGSSAKSFGLASGTGGPGGDAANPPVAALDLSSRSGCDLPFSLLFMALPGQGPERPARHSPGG